MIHRLHIWYTIVYTYLRGAACVISQSFVRVRASAHTRLRFRLHEACWSECVLCFAYTYGHTNTPSVLRHLANVHIYTRINSKHYTQQTLHRIAVRASRREHTHANVLVSFVQFVFGLARQFQRNDAAQTYNLCVNATQLTLVYDDRIYKSVVSNDMCIVCACPCIVYASVRIVPLGPLSVSDIYSAMSEHTIHCTSRLRPTWGPASDDLARAKRCAQSNNHAHPTTRSCNARARLAGSIVRSVVLKVKRNGSGF